MAFISKAAKTLLKPDGFKAGLLTALVMLGIYLRAGNIVDRGLRSIDSRLCDWMFNYRGPTPVSHRVVLIDVDEPSLRKYGQWPWPRDLLADLLLKLGAAEPAVIGLDMVFAEKDRLSPEACAEVLRRQAGLDIRLPEGLQDGDRRLGTVIEELPVILGYVFSDDPRAASGETRAPFPAGAPEAIDRDGKVPLPEGRYPVTNLPVISRFSRSEGFFNALPDPDGTIRSLPLFLRWDGNPYPSLALEMLREGMGFESYSPVTGSQGLVGLRLGPHFIPTDEAGRVRPNWRGKERTFPYISAGSVLDGTVPAAGLRGRYVIVGTSAAGLRDLRATPMAAPIPGMEIHATFIDNVLSDDLFRYDPVTERGVFLYGFLLGGFLLSALLAYSPPLLAGLSAFLAIAGVVVGNYVLFFRQNVVVGLTYPLVTTITVVLVVVVVNYLLEGRQKAFIRNAFIKYVSPRVVAEMVRDPSRLTLTGEVRQLTLLFCDIRDFTTIAERMAPDELSRFLNEYLTAMTDIILELQGTVDKFMGDAIMAFWGAPTAVPDQAALAVTAALRMQEKLVALSADAERGGFPRVAIRIGINTGPASVGNMGSRNRFDYTAMGDAVNVASRLEGLNKLYGTAALLSEATLREADIGERCRYVDTVRVKGKADATRIYEPLAEPLPDREREAWQAVTDAYRKRDLPRAAALLDELLRDFPNPVYANWRARISDLLAQGLPDDWDGVRVLDAK